MNTSYRKVCIALFIEANGMILLQYIILGFFQGIMEPLPISSSGHTILLKDLFNIQTPGLSFEIFIHLGSLIAIMIVYRRDIQILLRESFHYIFYKKPIFRDSFLYVLYLFVATAITGGIGLWVESYISTGLTTSLTVGFALLITSFFLWMVHQKKGTKSDSDITMKDAIIIGFIQAVALIPGISRSGATLVASLVVGMKREQALRFSFLLFIPISIGIHLLSLQDILTDSTIQAYIIPYLIAFIVATITTYFALKWFVKLVINGKLMVFSLYCLIVGFAVVLYQLI